MNKRAIIEIYSGQQVEISQLVLEKDGDETTMFLNVHCNGFSRLIKFINVSRLTLNDFFVPIIVSGFEIYCNNSKGWDKDSRYTIRDYEDDRIFFYCEDFE